MELNRLNFTMDAGLNSPKILLMDENQSTSHHLTTALIKLGYEISGEVVSMEEALLQTGQNKPDLVLLDADLNTRAGQTEMTISRYWESQDIPVIYLVADEESARAVASSGECHYGVVIKPAKSQDLRTTIEVAMQKHALEQQLHDNLNKSRQVYDFAPIIMFSFSIEGFISDVNRQWSSSIGYSAEEAVFQPVEFNLTPESSRLFREEVLPQLASMKRIDQVRIDYVKKDGTILNGILDASCDLEWEGDHVGLAVVRDVTEAIRLQEEEKAQRALAEALRMTAGLLTSTLNFDEVLDRILETVGSVVPHDAANIMMVWAGMAYVVRFEGYSQFGLDDFMMSVQASVSETPNLEEMYRTGRPVAIENMDLHPELCTQPEMNWRKSVASAPLRSRGVVFGFLNLESAQAGFFDLSFAERLQAFADQAAIAIENARLYAEVQQSAITDELTGVYNRRGLLELGRREIERARRYMRDLSILMIDIDHFKEINDTYSHATGDQVLVELTRRWRESLREVDLLGRIGGDEFTILLPETELDAATLVAGRLLEEISQKPFSTESGDINVTVSIGIAGVGKEITDLQELLARADNALYNAKKSGRNRVILAGKIGA
jgi:diguanylate cyclase (GGDEF)-like protein/PAS domain S-box-containing protein